MSEQPSKAEARAVLAHRILAYRVASGGMDRDRAMELVSDALDTFAAACSADAWDEGYQARQNDLGAADVTPNPYRKGER